jgi:hypothetical protein
VQSQVTRSLSAALNWFAAIPERLYNRSPDRVGLSNQALLLQQGQAPAALSTKKLSIPNVFAQHSIPRMPCMRYYTTRTARFHC